MAMTLQGWGISYSVTAKKGGRDDRRRKGESKTDRLAFKLGVGGGSSAHRFCIKV